MAGELERLAELRKTGALSDDEFAQAKKTPPRILKWHRQHGKLAAVKLDVATEPARATIRVA
jgi:hypothetical protein